jgi:hypothetical protein
MTSGKPILVTGAHRTGTTWVGKMLAANPQTEYISEPLNVWHRPGVMRAPVTNWYTYIQNENEGEYLTALRATLDFRYSLWREIRAVCTFKDVLRMGRDLSVFQRGRLLGQRPLLKDPFAVFSTVWFAQRLNCDIVILIRHPAGFASSLKRLNWMFDFRDLLDQPLLMRDWLDDDRADMEAIQADDVIGQAALLWRIIYRVVNRIQETNPEFTVVRHEDLSIDPVNGFRQLYEALGLVFTDKVAQAVRNSSGAENPSELAKSNAHSVKLDSRLNVKNWKKRLNSDELSRIRGITESVAFEYYPEGSW